MLLQGSRIKSTDFYNNFQIFELYAPIQEAVTDIRFQSLLLVDTDEFSAEAVWNPPTVNVILEQMFCPHCVLNIDVDICAQKHPENESDGKFVVVDIHFMFFRTFPVSGLFTTIVQVVD